MLHSGTKKNWKNTNNLYEKNENVLKHRHWLAEGIYLWIKQGLASRIYDFHMLHTACRPLMLL